jgi:hypothetical protein
VLQGGVGVRPGAGPLEHRVPLQLIQLPDPVGGEPPEAVVAGRLVPDDVPGPDVELAPPGTDPRSATRRQFTHMALLPIHDGKLHHDQRLRVTED